MDVVIRIDVAAEPSTVWSVLQDVRDWPRWTASIDAVTPLDSGPLRVGGRARVKQPGTPALVWEVTELAEGRSFTWQTRSPGVRTVGYHEISATAGGSVLELRLEQRGPLAGVLRLLMGARTRRYVRMEADGLKAASERAQAAAP